MGAGQLIPPALAIYAALMWATKGTTIGGVICNLRVVRLDDRPIDWATAIVAGRSAVSFRSWSWGWGSCGVAFDDQKQSWHDKIAGTTVGAHAEGDVAALRGFNLNHALGTGSCLSFCLPRFSSVPHL